LPEAALAEIARVLPAPRSFARGEKLFREDSEVHHIYLVEEGWLATPEDLPDGGKLYRSVYLPGDVAGLSELAWVPTNTDLVALTDGAAGVLDRREVYTLGATAPLLTSVLLTIGIAQQVAATDRLAHALRADGRSRLLFFLLDLEERQCADDENDRAGFPITQAEIADAIGLSKVHVNVLLRELCESGHLHREGRTIRLTDRAATAEEVGYRPRLTNLDLSWTKAVRISADSDAA
jgi:CRP-like cAMP-binding protein